MSVDELKAAALKLSLEARAKLAHALLLSLDELSEAEIEEMWLEVAERRLREFDEGKVRGIPAEEVFDKAYGRLNR
jgi:putative addiction module component (TIGR02574 family)